MAYYGLDSFACNVIHFKKWKPFIGQFWCPICEKLRLNPKKEESGKFGFYLTDPRDQRSVKEEDE